MTAGGVKELSIEGIRGAVVERRTTALALAEDFYERIEKDDGEIGAFLTLSEDRAFAQAARIDKLAAEGQPLPPLAGVPIAIKDVMVTRGVRTTAASKILENFVPPSDCTAVARLEAAGAVILGKLNCDEFAMGSSTENSAYRPVRNPRDKTRVPEARRAGRPCGGPGDGGCNSGFRYRRLDSSACFVLRRCGFEADLRASFALWPDCVCFVTRPHWAVCQYRQGCRARAPDNRRPDPMDSTSADVPVPDYVAEMAKPLANSVGKMRVGVARSISAPASTWSSRRRRSGDPATRSARLRNRPVSLPHTEYAIPAYYIVATAELRRILRAMTACASVFARAVGTPHGDVSPDARRRLWHGSEAADHARHLRAQRGLLRCLLFEGAKSPHAADARLRRGLQEVDVIAAPTAPTTAFKLGEKVDDPLAMYLADSTP